MKQATSARSARQHLGQTGSAATRRRMLGVRRHDGPPRLMQRAVAARNAGCIVTEVLCADCFRYVLEWALAGQRAFARTLAPVSNKFRRSVAAVLEESVATVARALRVDEHVVRQLNLTMEDAAIVRDMGLHYVKDACFAVERSRTYVCKTRTFKSCEVWCQFSVHRLGGGGTGYRIQVNTRTSVKNDQVAEMAANLRGTGLQRVMSPSMRILTQTGRLDEKGASRLRRRTKSARRSHIDLYPCEDDESTCGLDWYSEMWPTWPDPDGPTFQLVCNWERGGAMMMSICTHCNRLLMPRQELRVVPGSRRRFGGLLRRNHRCTDIMPNCTDMMPVPAFMEWVLLGR